MRVLAIGAAFAALSAAPVLAAAAPAPPAPSLKEYASAAEVQALMDNAKAKRTNEPNYIQPLLRLAPYAANLEYRMAVGPAAVHEHEAEMFYVVKGAGDLTTGGTLVGQTRPNPANLSGTAITGGSTRRISEGDFVIVPENTPHWFGVIAQAPLVLMAIHVPRN
jgi:mannose-6-phosphate isomerase-like protein (cupin superfamily)